MKLFLIAIVVLISGCFTDDHGTGTSLTVSETPVAAPESQSPVVGYSVYPVENNTISNKEAVIPPQCYTRHEGEFNPCMVCHQNYSYGSRPNYMFDKGLQSEYDFSDYGFTNRWHNLFEDRRDRIAAVSDEEIDAQLKMLQKNFASHEKIEKDLFYE